MKVDKDFKFLEVFNLESINRNDDSVWAIGFKTNTH